MAKCSGTNIDRNLHSRPLLCSDVINVSQPIPERLEFLNENNSSNSYDALVVSVHVLMLELGFHPVGISDNMENTELPEKWKSEETYKLSYYHTSCPDVFANITGIKVGSFIAVFAKVQKEQKSSSLEEYNLHLLVKDYVRIEPNTEKLMYHNLPTLSRNFKDNIGLPLIIGCQEAAEMTPTVGFSSLPTEIKTLVLSYLDARSLLRIGCVNKELNELADLQRLWKRRLEHDFSALSSLNIDGPNNYKMAYKMEYLDRKQRQKARETYIVPQLPYPFQNPFSPIWPDRFYDFSSGVPPEIRGAFPHIRIRADLPPRFPLGQMPRFL